MKKYILSTILMSFLVMSMTSCEKVLFPNNKDAIIRYINRTFSESNCTVMLCPTQIEPGKVLSQIEHYDAGSSFFSYVEAPNYRSWLFVVDDSRVNCCVIYYNFVDCNSGKVERILYNMPPTNITLEPVKRWDSSKPFSLPWDKDN